MAGSRTPYRYFYLCSNPSRRAHPKQQNKRHGNCEGELTMDVVGMGQRFPSHHRHTPQSDRRDRAREGHHTFAGARNSSRAERRCGAVVLAGDEPAGPPREARTATSGRAAAQRRPLQHHRGQHRGPHRPNAATLDSRRRRHHHRCS